jgi:hypothetical protein
LKFIDNLSVLGWLISAGDLRNASMNRRRENASAGNNEVQHRRIVIVVSKWSQKICGNDEFAADALEDRGRLAVVHELVSDEGFGGHARRHLFSAELIPVNDASDEVTRHRVNLKKEIGPLQGWQRIGAVASRLGIRSCDIQGRSFVANRLSCTRPEQPSENPQSASDKDKTTSKPSYPPVWFRIPLASLFGFGANGPMIMAGFVRRTSLRWSLFGLGL